MFPLEHLFVDRVPLTKAQVRLYKFEESREERSSCSPSRHLNFSIHTANLQTIQHSKHAHRDPSAETSDRRRKVFSHCSLTIHSWFASRTSCVSDHSHPSSDDPTCVYNNESPRLDLGDTQSFHTCSSNSGYHKPNLFGNHLHVKSTRIAGHCHIRSLEHNAFLPLPDAGALLLCVVLHAASSRECTENIGATPLEKRKNKKA